MNEFLKRWHKVNDNYDCRAEVTNKPHPSKVISAMMLVASKLKDGPDSFAPHSEHDILYLCPTDDLVELSVKDIVTLSCLGVHCDSSSDSLAMFN